MYFFALFIYRFLTELFFIKNIFKHNPNSIKNIEEVKIFISHRFNFFINFRIRELLKNLKLTEN